MLSRRCLLTPALLGLGLGLTPWTSAVAQISPSMSSGSGPGTGTGGSPSFRSNIPGGSPFRPRPNLGPMPAGDLPDALESLADPSFGMPLSGLRITKEQADRMLRDLTGLANSIQEPSPRVQALDRAARTEIQTVRDSRAADNVAKLDAIRASLVSAWNSLRQISHHLVHDNRAVSLSEALTMLGEVYQDQALVSDDMAFLDESLSVAPRSVPERRKALDRSLEAYAMAASVANEVHDANIRGEVLSKVADGLARSGQEIATARFQIIPQSPSELPETLDQEQLADQALNAAADHARMIQRSVWRNRALVAVVLQAASANRFQRALAIARSIDEPQARSEALIQTAEAQARSRGQAQAATESYHEAARAIASIPQEDPRSILAEVLIASLNQSGRFLDAVASVSLLSDPVNRYEAYGTIAEQMGRRGLDREARNWIIRRASPEHQSHLLRRVAMGMTASIEQYRTNAQSGRGLLEPSIVNLPPEAELPPPREATPPPPSPIQPPDR